MWYAVCLIRKRIIQKLIYLCRISGGGRSIRTEYRNLSVWFSNQKKGMRGLCLSLSWEKVKTWYCEKVFLSFVLYFVRDTFFEFVNSDNFVSFWARHVY